MWNNETSVQLHAVNIHQKWSVCDLRQSNDNKDRLLKGFVRVADKVAVYVNDKTTYGGYYEPAYMELLNYGEPATASMVVLYDLPELPIKKIFKQLRKDKVENIILLYNNSDKHAIEKRLQLSNPQREQMAVAYKNVMESLTKGSIDKQTLLEQYIDSVSENALLVMEELGFVILQDGAITKGIIKKSNLEDSSLYRSLQQQRQQLMSCYLDNLRLSQHELLRI